MIYLVSYDITKDKPRAKLHRYLKEHGLNTQKSVFECDIENQALRRIISKAGKLMDSETDSVRIYGICRACTRKVVVQGRGIQILEHDFEVV